MTDTVAARIRIGWPDGANPEIVEKWAEGDGSMWFVPSATSADSPRDDMGHNRTAQEYAAGTVPFSDDWPATLQQTVSRQFLRDINSEAFQDGWDAARVSNPAYVSPDDPDVLKADLAILRARFEFMIEERDKEFAKSQIKGGFRGSLKISEPGPVVAPTARSVDENGLPTHISEREALAVTITLFKECQVERDAYREALEDIKDEKYRYYAQYEGSVETPSYFDFIEGLLSQYEASRKP